MLELLSPSNKERGAALVEYALLAALIAIAAIVSINLVGGAVTSTFTEAGGDITRGGVVEQSKTAVVAGEIAATFEVTNGKVYLGAVEADGWTYKTMPWSNDTRIVMKFTNTDTGAVMKVKGRLNKKGKLKATAKPW